MLTIRNIEGLNDKVFGKWTVIEAIEQTPRRWLSCEHYSISFDRGGRGAAILIDRNINRLTKQYHIYICYNDFTDVIYECGLSKLALTDSVVFIRHMMGYMNNEYDLRDPKKQ
jgi:hypothetical protein